MATIRVKSANIMRKDTASSWSENNPVLRQGEEGYETDTGKRKVGDGSTAWNDLSYTVDQVYNPDSVNAQSGKAVAEALMRIEAQIMHTALMTGTLITDEENSANTLRIGDVVK